MKANYISYFTPLVQECKCLFIIRMQEESDPESDDVCFGFADDVVVISAAKVPSVP